MIVFITPTSCCFANLRVDRVDIAAVTHLKARPTQLPAAMDIKTLKGGFMGEHYAVYIMALDQWLQFFSHLASAETGSRRMIRMLECDVKMICCCNSPSLTVTDVSHLTSDSTPLWEEMQAFKIWAYLFIYLFQRSRKLSTH